MNSLYELSMELTNECTLSCLHCSSGSIPKKMPNELELDDHIRIMKEARGLGAQILSLSGGNPLLYKDLPALVIVAMEMQFQRLLIYTTGHNHYGRTIDMYPHLNILKVPGTTFIFSLHSHIAEVNDYIMNLKGAWQNIIDSITWLKACNADVEIHMVPMKPNYRHIKEVRDLCASLNVSKMSLLRFVPQTRGAQNVAELGMDVSDFSRMQYIIDDAFDDDRSVIIRAGCPIDFRHAVGLFDTKLRPCHAGDDLMLVRPDGSVHPCAAWKSLPASDSNVHEHPLKYIWENSEVFNEIRAFKAGGYSQIEGTCSACKMLDSCMGGCPAQRLHAYGKTLEAMYVDKSDPLCPCGAR